LRWPQCGPFVATPIGKTIEITHRGGRCPSGLIAKLHLRITPRPLLSFVRNGTCWVQRTMESRMAALMPEENSLFVSRGSGRSCFDDSGKLASNGRRRALCSWVRATSRNWYLKPGRFRLCPAQSKTGDAPPCVHYGTGFRWTLETWLLYCKNRARGPELERSKFRIGERFGRLEQGSPACYAFLPARAPRMDNRPDSAQSVSSSAQV